MIMESQNFLLTVESDQRDFADTDLVEAFKNGSTDAMERIVEIYAPSVFTFGLKMCGQKQDAEDIAQETFLNAFRYLDRFRGETKLKNWLFKIAARACMRKRRKKKCAPDHELSLESFIRNGEEVGIDIPDLADGPADHLLKAELRGHIDEAIQELPPKYRIVFSLRDLQGFNTEETAEILGISIQSVKTRLHRARLFIREKISHHYGRGGLQ
ncbi:MAG TPA: sigma-70 family RNA polymerase sigma factor [Desulfobacteraceae bacterium]|nr:sigma-70 family RNA polymerase sigma factor [Desulfobacteraceae bacterium]